MIPAMSRETLGETYRRMLLMRRFEEACIKLWHDKILPGHYHVYIGEEATGAAVGAVRQSGDHVFTTHRNHGHLLACGADPGRVMAEILAKATGYNRGRGGTLHVAAAELGIPHTSGLVGSSIPIAMGAALAAKQRGSKAVSISLFGDGALEEGAYFETVNMAALWKLPLIFVCENNTWDTRPSTPEEYPGSTTAANPLTDLATCFKIPVITVDGADLGASAAAVTTAIERARAGGGPTFIEARTRRWAGTRPLWPALSTGETDLSVAWTGKVPEGFDEHRDWYLHDDPVLRLTRELLAVGFLTKETASEVDAAVRRQMADAVTFAIESPYPKPEEALEGVWP